MATEFEVKSWKGATTIALIGVAGVIALVIATEWLIPLVRSKLKV